MNRLNQSARGWMHRIAMGIVACLTGVTPAIAVPAKEGPTGWWLPPAATSVAERVDGLFMTILWITLAFLLLVTTLLVVFIVQYRRRDGARAHYITGNARLEFLWGAVPAVLLAVIAVMSTSLWSAMKREEPRDEDAVVVLVRPRQFQWDVTYPGRDGRFGTNDDVTAINRVDVPAGRDVVVRLEAQDVIHSFFVPEFRLKQDAVPGMTTRLWFNVPRAGEYEIACAELCGLGHYRMRGVLVVHEAGDYERWMAGRIAEGEAALRSPAP